MPEPVEAEHRYIPGLDGLRAFAVLAVIVYHLNVGWAQGGLLGVGVFFTLSGYLITDLLLEHWGRPTAWGSGTSGCGGPGACCPPWLSCWRSSSSGSPSPTVPSCRRYAGTWWRPPST